jgi:hypothetical protein
VNAGGSAVLAPQVSGSRDGLVLRDQDIDLTQLRDDLGGFVTLSRHESVPPHCHETSLQMNQSNGGWITA